MTKPIEITKKIETKKYNQGINACEFIIIHHTAGGTFESNCNLLAKSKNPVSVHFVIGEKGEIAKIGTPENIMRHCGISEWGIYENLNFFAIGIEIVGPNSKGQFTEEQYYQTIKLIKHLQIHYGIKQDYILRHCDITHSQSKQKILYNGTQKTRKVDIYDSFWIKYVKSWAEFQNLFKN